MRKLIIFCFTVFVTGNVMADDKKNIFGYIENANLIEKNISVLAKLDTGAKTASLNAVDINEVEINDIPYVRFTVPTKNGPVVFQQKFIGRVKIKARAEESLFRSEETGALKRPVVLLKIKLGNEVRSIRVNLTSRQHFNYPLLLGRDAIIAFDGIVDPSKTFIIKEN